MIQDGLAMIFEKFIRALVIAMAVGTPAWAQAQQLIGSYVALLSEADHFNSSGQRLTSAAAIIRQDRANFHRFGIKDPQDEGDTFFADEGNRAALEQMLERGRAEPGVIARIVNGTPLIRVDIYRAGSGPFIKVTLIDRQQTGNPPPVPNNDVQEYAGPFTTEYLYAMCSQNDIASRERRSHVRKTNRHAFLLHRFLNVQSHTDLQTFPAANAIPGGAGTRRASRNHRHHWRR
jgi:hypothetical protein